MSVASDINDRPSLFSCLWRPVGVICGLIACAVGFQFLPHPDPVRLEAWSKVEPRLRQMDEETKTEVHASTEQVKKFFAERKEHARSFAADVLSLRGKWAYVTGYFQEGNHERYLEECFEKHIFGSAELKAMIESAVSRYVSEIQGRENQLLVAIRADLEGSELAGPNYLPSLGSDADFRREYDAMLQKVLPVIQKDLGVTVTR
jgi:hypothetical protein